MKTLFQTDSQTILLEGTIEKPTERDWGRINPIIDELKAKHRGENGIIAYRSSKKSGYKKLAVEWRSKPKLVPND